MQSKSHPLKFRDRIWISLTILIPICGLRLPMVSGLNFLILNENLPKSHLHQCSYHFLGNNKLISQKSSLFTKLIQAKPILKLLNQWWVESKNNSKFLVRTIRIFFPRNSTWCFYFNFYCYFVNLFTLYSSARSFKYRKKKLIQIQLSAKLSVELARNPDNLHHIFFTPPTKLCVTATPRHSVNFFNVHLCQYPFLTHI